MSRKREEGGGPAWLATFADMMSLLMAFFVMLFAMSTIEQQKYEAVVRSLTDSLGHGRDLSASQLAYFQKQKQQTTPQDNTGTAERKSQIDELKPLYESLIETFRKSIADGQLKIQLEGNGNQVRITFPSKFSFSAGSARLTPAFIDALAELPDWKSLPVEVQVLGHTDDLPVRGGRFRNNWELSGARAGNVAQALLKLGKVRPQQVRAIGLADTEPLTQDPTKRALNRRVEIVVRTVAREQPAQAPGAHGQ